MEYRLSPSDLTFLYDGCKRCFVLKVRHGIRQPSIPLPGVFSSIPYLQKEHYSGTRTDSISPNAPPGVITHGEQWVEIPRDETAFRAFLGDVVDLLDGPMPASGGDACDWCKYSATLSRLMRPASGTQGVGAETIEAPRCPKCGGAMQLRTGKYGEFWSCLRYPACRGTRNA